MSEVSQYQSAFYFCLVTITTVGYGDILPDTATVHVARDHSATCTSNTAL